MLPMNTEYEPIAEGNNNYVLYAFNKMKPSIVRFFEIEERGSSLQQEIRAGITTFLTMCYILLVNPQILSKAGIPAQQVVLSTAISAGR